MMELTARMLKITIIKMLSMLKDVIENVNVISEIEDSKKEPNGTNS